MTCVHNCSCLFQCLLWIFKWIILCRIESCFGLGVAKGAATANPPTPQLCAWKAWKGDLGWRSSRVAVIKLATEMCWRSACYQTACGNVLISLLSLSNCLWKCEEDQLAILVKLAMEIRWRSACYQTACGNVLISLLWSSNCLWKCVHLLRFQFLLFKSAVIITAWIDKHELNSRRPNY